MSAPHRAVAGRMRAELPEIEVEALVQSLPSTMERCADELLAFAGFLESL